MTEPVPRFQVVPRQPKFGGRGVWISIVVAWLASLGLVWWLAVSLAAPGAGEARVQLRAAERTAAARQRELDEVNQRLVTLQMPYGKYKGTVLADLPGNYLNWFAREGFPKGELGQLLALMHEIDHNGLSDLLLPLRRAGAAGR